MKQLKVIIWLITIGLLGLIMYQNRDYFLARHSLGIDLLSIHYKSPEWSAGIFFMAFFLIGWLLAYLSSLADRFRDAKTIKRLQQAIHVQQNAIDSMKKDVDALKPKIEQSEAEPPVESLNEADTIRL